ncbi:MAG: helicase-associated domain-containing protein [Actinoplanes sp.]
MFSVAALAHHLRTLTEEQLTQLVSIRRDATIEPAPRTTEHLAERLLLPGSMAGACGLLTLPQLQVAEAAAALGDGCTPVRLAALLGVSEDDPDLTAALSRLTALVLLWPRDGRLAAAHLDVIWPSPLDLGSSAAALFVDRGVNELRNLAKIYGIPAKGRGKDELIAALAGWLAEPEHVLRLAVEAPAEVRTQLDAFARRPVSPFGRSGVMFGSPGPVLPWAVDRGLLVDSMWGVSEMPREVAFALREDVKAPFSPRPPVTPLSPVESAAVEREAAAAATETLAAITAVVEAMSGDPVPLLRTGGLGVRELRRITKLSKQDEDRVRLTIELLAAGGLVEAPEAGLIPSTVYDEFAAAEPADQLLRVIEDWLSMPASPLAPVDDTATSARLLYWDEREERTLTGLRVLALRTIHAIVPDGQSIDPRVLAARLSWEGPLMTDQVDEDLELYVTGIWREAHRLGLLAHGAMTALGRSLLSGDGSATRGQAEAMVPRSRDSVLLQNDLTAVVTGTPSAGLLALLDSVATPESRSGAWTWRFSPASVRAALDAGNTPEELIASITEVAEGGRVPQPLTYLIDDVARRHGHVQVRPVVCCLSSDDELLLTEILNTRSLKALKLVRLAPTVLASTKSPDVTLAALRAAGYAPAGLRADGSPVVKIPQRRRAVPSSLDGGLEEMFPGPSLRNPAEVAKKLLGKG